MNQALDETRLVLKRKWYSPTTTIGELYVNDTLECFTLEDTVRLGPKQYGCTAIPAGTYPVDITWSPRFQRDMPLLFNVPGFEGVRIHTGNTAADTEGCILVGTSSNQEDFIGNSRLAYQSLLTKLEHALDRKQKVTITIEDDPEALKCLAS